MDERIKVGRKVAIKSHRKWDHGGGLFCGEIAKVGRKYFYVQDARNIRTYRFRLNDFCNDEGDDMGSHCTFYFSEKEWQDESLANKLVRVIRNSLDSKFVRQCGSLGKLKAIAEIIGLEVENEEG